MNIPRKVRIVEVGPRDGLQNEASPVSTADKVAFVDALTDAGHSVIEVSAFVSPRWVPQMADAGEVFARIRRSPGVRYTALVPNAAGLARARAAGVDEIAIFAATSETFSKRNINQTIADSLATYEQVCDEARAAGLRVRGYLSTCFGCPYEGRVPPVQVANVAARLQDLGAYEIALCDTVGIAHPGQVPEVVGAVAARVARERIALHFHDTRGTALVNVLTGLDEGITVFDAAAGGLGGCPFAPGAAGNLATEDLLFVLDGLGIETGVRLDGVMAASRAIEQRLTHRLPSRVLQVEAARH